MKVLVFSGTTEGKEIAGFLNENRIQTTVSVATEYGKAVMEGSEEYITVHVGRLDEQQMIDFAKGFQLIIDATHPYAVLVTENIKRVADDLGIAYIRLLRDRAGAASEDKEYMNSVHVQSVEAAANYLKENIMQGERIFVSTGSKELEQYTVIPDYEETLVVRVLPARESEEKCRQLAIGNVIYDKGPFTLEQNHKTFKKYQVNWLVTKEAGKAGGFMEKVKAAEQLGIKIVIVDRPVETEGMNMEQTKNRILELAGKEIEDCGIEIVKPMDIERRSFEIITERLKGRSFGTDKDDIVKRVIHTTADFDYGDNLVFSENVVEQALDAIRKGATIVTDTNMALSGINKKILQSFGGQACCFMADEDVAEAARAREITRAMVSMEKACSIQGPLILAIGNAPTALIWIDKLVRNGRLKPSLVIGVPVGFVNVVESKELIIKSGIPHIVARGNKGGSNVAAAICNALLYKLRR